MKNGIKMEGKIFSFKIFEIVYLLLLGDGRFCLTDLSKRGRSTGYGLNETVSNFRAKLSTVDLLNPMQT